MVLYFNCDLTTSQFVTDDLRSPHLYDGTLAAEILSSIMPVKPCDKGYHSILWASQLEPGAY
jgi:hypothetical protein